MMIQLVKTPPLALVFYIDERNGSSSQGSTASVTKIMVVVVAVVLISVL
jgi:hypothetical protein